jgi:hypothetical protein
MTKSEFQILINGVSFISFKVAQKYLTNMLALEFRYDVFLNVSNDESSLIQFDIYPEDDKKIVTGLTDKEVSDLLFKNGRVPVWIDISVYTSDENITTFKLLCAGRYSNNTKEFYYHKRGTGPFGIKSPNLPVDYEEGTKFRLRTKKPI